MTSTHVGKSLWNETKGLKWEPRDAASWLRPLTLVSSSLYVRNHLSHQATRFTRGEIQAIEEPARHAEWRGSRARYRHAATTKLGAPSPQSCSRCHAVPFHLPPQRHGADLEGVRGFASVSAEPHERALDRGPLLFL